MDQGLAGCPCNERPDDVRVGNVGKLVTLPREATDVLPESLIRLLAAALEVPGVPRAYVRALEVVDEDLPEVGPTINPVGREMLELAPRGVGQVEREVADDEKVIRDTSSP